MPFPKIVNTVMNPVEWTNQPNTKLQGCFLQTTVDQFGANITISGEGGFSHKLNPIPLENRPFGYYTIGDITIPFSAFPITISSEIRCSTKFDVVESPQMPLGEKPMDKDLLDIHTEPVCYQSTTFCNDNADNPNRDLDYNDFVLVWQLYNASTD